ncbi:hypothetical protein OAC62_05715 [Amylibacter sp.]|nr:hypothetical protein [Amylibacter sp.]
MYKLLFVFLMFVSSPLYSDEFTFHCDSDDKLLSTVYKINTSNRSIVHTHTIIHPISKEDKSNVFEGKGKLNVYRWNEYDKSIWIVSLSEIFLHPESVTTVLLNFEVGSKISHNFKNITPRSEGITNTDTPFLSTKSDCYILE